MSPSNLLHALAIFGSAFILEDAAVLGAALLVVNSMISLPWAAGSSFAGIWLGDLGLYAIALQCGRPVLERPWFKRFIGKKIDFSRSEAWFQDHGTAAVFISRAIPGTRLPTYLAAGLLKIPAVRFLSLTATACVLWVGALFFLSYHVGMMAISEFHMFKSETGKLVACAALAALLVWPLRNVKKLLPFLRKMARWEFWPPAVFYIPVALKYLALAIRYHSVSLPTLANPGMQTGGLIGESKYQTLADLARSYPEFVAETRLIQSGLPPADLEYPVVFKPDVGQRGLGFRIVRSSEDAQHYREQYSRDFLIQRYVPGPYEAGIFYYRFPHVAQGHIFAITEKVFPSVVGDGERTLEELVFADRRGRLVADTYLKRFADQKTRVLDEGESFRLVEAGNHCQGAIFLDGSRLLTHQLERRIDQISRSINGFFVGRYDVRYSSEEALRDGTGFQIIELNGASAEATAIYDPSNSLWSAYRTLFRQWEIVFEIADQNRRRGFPGTPVGTIWRNFIDYRKHAALYSVSD